MRQPATVALTGREDGGAVTLVHGPVPFGETWHLERLTVETDSLTTTSFSARLDGERLGSLLDRTASGNADVAEYGLPGVVIPSGTSLVLRWETISAGASAAARVQYAVERRPGVN